METKSVTIKIPANGSRVIFSALPIASYATIGEVYEVSHNEKDRKGDVYLRNVATGSGTFDRKRFYRTAKWEYVA